MSITPSADLISQGMSIYEKLISAIDSDKTKRVTNLIGSSFRLLGNDNVRIYSKTVFFTQRSCITYF